MLDYCKRKCISDGKVVVDDDDVSSSKGKVVLSHSISPSSSPQSRSPLDASVARCAPSAMRRGETLKMMVQEGQVEEEEEQGVWRSAGGRHGLALALSYRSPWLLPLIASYIGLKMTKLDLMTV